MLSMLVQPDGGVAKTILVEGQGYEKPESGDEVTGASFVMPPPHAAQCL